MDIIGGGTPKTSKSEYWDGDIPWLSVKDFNDENKYVYTTEKSISQLGLSNSSTCLLQKEDLIISARGTVGELAMLAIPMAFNQSCYGLRANPEIIKSHFLYYLLKYNLKILKNNTHGSVFDTITRDTFSNVKVLIPSFDIQEKITRILSNLDSKIELNIKINNNLEQQAQALFKSWFVDKFNPNRRTIKAEEIFNISIGKTPPRKEPEWFSENPNNIKWVSISDMGSCGMYISDSSEYLIPSAISKFNIKIVPSNTVLLSFKLTVGRIAITDGEMTTNEAIAHFITNRTEINEYLYCYLRNFNFQTMGSTSSIATAVNSKIIKSMPFVMPEENELKDFHSVVSPMFAQIKFNQSENTRLAELRDALLPKLMSGEIDVSNVNIDDLASADKLSFIIIYVLLRFVTQKTFKRTLST